MSGRIGTETYSAVKGIHSVPIQQGRNQAKRLAAFSGAGFHQQFSSERNVFFQDRCRIEGRKNPALMLNAMNHSYSQLANCPLEPTKRICGPRISRYLWQVLKCLSPRYM